MSGESKRISELAVATTLSGTDRVVVLTSPASSAQTKTITLTNFGANLTSNNTNYVGSVSAANIVSNAQLVANLANYVSNAQLTSNLANYQTAAGLSGNVATLTANNTNFVGSVSAANVVSNAQLSGNLSNYQTTSGLSANVVKLTANNTNFVGSVSAANVVSNAQLSSNLAGYVTSTSLTNNLANYQTTAGLATNVAILSANNSNNLGGIAAASYVQNTDSRTLSGNLVFTGNLTVNSSITFSDSSVQSRAYTGFANVTLASTSATVVANNSYDIILCDTNAAGSDINVTLPIPGSNGKIFTVKNINAGGYSAIVKSSDNSSTIEIQGGSGALGTNTAISTSGISATWVYYDGCYRIISNY